MVERPWLIVSLRPSPPPHKHCVIANVCRRTFFAASCFSNMAPVLIVLIRKPTRRHLNTSHYTRQKCEKQYVCKILADGSRELNSPLVLLEVDMAHYVSTSCRFWLASWRLRPWTVDGWMKTDAAPPTFSSGCCESKKRIPPDLIP